MKERKEARCAGRWWLFESVTVADHAIARTACHGTNRQDRCPLFDHCNQTVEELLASRWRSGVHGTWAGRLYGSQMKKEEVA